MTTTAAEFITDEACLIPPFIRNLHALYAIYTPSIRLRRTKKMFCEWRKHYGWLMAAICHIQYFFGFGTMASYVLLYVELEKEFENTSATALGWVASVAWGLSSLMSVLTSPLYERFGHQKIITIGVFLTFLGILGTTFAPNLWVMYLTFGVVLGVGFNFVYNPSINLVTMYFPKVNSTRATALASSGASTGLLVMCPLLDLGFHLIGWRNSYRLLAGIYLITSLPLCMLTKPPCPNYHRPIPDSKNDKDFSAEKGKFIVATTEPKVPDAADDRTISKATEGVVYRRSRRDSYWVKYISLYRLPQHWFYFFGTLTGTLAAIFNNINLGSFFTHAGYDEDKATFYITAMTIAELLTRMLIATFGDYLPCARTLLLPVACTLAGAVSLLLGFYTGFAAVVMYLAGIGIARGFIYSMAYGVAVEVFTAEKCVEVYTSLLVAFGLGGLLGSTIPGLSFDLTGSYAASLHICAGIWWFCGLLYLALYLTYRRETLRASCITTISSPETEVQKPSTIAPSEGYATLLNENVTKQVDAIV